MPGVIVRTSVRAGSSAPMRAASGTWFVTGMVERGPIDRPVELRSMGDYARLLGDRVPYGHLYDSLLTFFEEGGTRAYVARVTGPTPTTGDLVLQDRALVNTLRIVASSPGAWSSRVSVQVADDVNPNTFQLIIRIDGQRAEEYRDLRDPADAVAQLNRSALVRAVNLGSVSAAPTNNPAPTPERLLTAGTDDRANATATHFLAALGRFTEEYGTGAVSIPGLAQTVHVGLIEHAERNRRIALLSAARGTTREQLQTMAQALRTAAAGLFAPYLQIPDDVAGTRTVDPTGYIAAVRNRAHEEAGPWRAPGGEIARSRFVVGLDQEFRSSEARDLDVARVNVIRTIAGSVRLYGWRSLSPNTVDYGFLISQDLLNYLSVRVEEILEQYVFQPIDARGQLLGRVSGDLIGLCEVIRGQNGLFERVDQDSGALIDPGYVVDTSANLNTLQAASANEIHARVGVRPSPTASTIFVEVVKSAVASATV